MVDLLYHKERKLKSLELEYVADIKEDDGDTNLLDAEIKAAIAEMKNNKAVI